MTRLEYEKTVQSQLAKYGNKYVNWACPGCGSIRKLCPSVLEQYVKARALCRSCTSKMYGYH